jgi:uncharacterized protein
MKKKKRLAIPIMVILALVIITILYSVFDNNRVVLVTQQVEIENLPEEFEGFKILQISDLHGKRFGENQQQLLSMINETPYDMLVFSGDMADGSIFDNQPFFDLLDGITNKKYAYTIGGNTGPWGIEEFTGIVTEDGEILESKGVHNLNSVFTIKRGESRIFVSEFQLIEWEKLYLSFARQQLENSNLPAQEIKRYQNEEKYALQRINELSLIQPEDTLLGISHIPFSIDSLSTMPDIIPAYDLVLAGHYHGGQIRLPLICALYIPDGASETHGYFPSQDKVSGLRDWGDFQQYVTRGLGSSSSMPLLNFRLFNTPEINLITLVAKK